MARFVDWLNAPASGDPVMKAGVAHLWFVTIHPFEDGNGRIARALADMALTRADGAPRLATAAVARATDCVLSGPRVTSPSVHVEPAVTLAGF